jgi:NSS family neurotransmitter:Na+ symporter
LIFAFITILIVTFGVQKGIENMSKILMPALAVMAIFLMTYVLCQPGALEGVKYVLLPDFSKFGFETVLGALGQLFYSMSIGMCIMITYGSYMKKDVNLESSVRQIEIFDTGIAFLAGLMIIPAVFVFSGGDESALGQGPGLMFVTLPKVFESMAGGAVIGTLFFVLVLFAALTSSISLMETIVSIFSDKFKMTRTVACISVFVLSLVLGIPSSLGNGIWANVKIIGMDFLSFFDFITNNVMMPVVAFVTCILVGYVIKPQSVIEEVELNGKFKAKGLFSVMIKYVAPICIVAILIFSVCEGLGFIKV